MQQTIESMMTAIMDRYEQNPEQDIRVLIHNMFKEWNVPAEALNELEEALGLLDAYDNEYADLQKHRENGGTRPGWISSKMDTMTKDCTDEQKAQLATALTDALENQEKELTQE